jgi:hypothetical protein
VPQAQDGYFMHGRENRGLFPMHPRDSPPLFPVEAIAMLVLAGNMHPRPTGLCQDDNVHPNGQPVFFSRAIFCPRLDHG